VVSCALFTRILSMHIIRTGLSGPKTSENTSPSKGRIVYPWNKVKNWGIQFRD
jgi:hypothetical protein